MIHDPVPARRWRDAEALFTEASHLPPGKPREEFVSQRCGVDTWLRDEVLSLLRYDSQDESPLLDALRASAASLLSDDLAPGDTAGPYRIESEIGRGGMAVVYEAVRADGEFRKRVAIKVIKRGMDTAAIVERLRRERRILAALDHPWIARLLDGGTLPDGRPWIAMEFVEGLPIDRYCDEHGLGIEDRVRLIDKVCDAVACAHRNLVIHRDLKPGNILVAADGNPRLLDFGIARLLDTSNEDTERPLTVGLFHPLTPEYASPEQLRGETADTAADIYSVGVILYELLAGQRPKGPVKASAAALDAGRDRRWSKHLEGDLDNILGMALRPEAERRYRSVDQMQTDLRRHLAGLPVSASGESWRYRASKFRQRHPVGVPAAAVAALAAVAGIVTIVHAERDAQAQRAKAEQRLGQLVELANAALFDIHDSIAHLPGATEARRKIVDSTLQYLDRLNAESGGDPRVLAALASAYQRVARVQGSTEGPNLGKMTAAGQTYQKAEKIFDTLSANNESRELRLHDAEFREEYGHLLVDIGRIDAGLVQFQRGMQQMAAVLSQSRSDADARKREVNLRLEIIMAKKTAGDAEGALRADTELLPLTEGLAHDYPSDSESLLDLAQAFSQRSEILAIRGGIVEALEPLQRSTAIRERALALRPHDVVVQRELMMSWGKMGDLAGSPLFVSPGNWNDAIVWYRKARDLAHELAAGDPSDVQAKSDEGTASSRIAMSEYAAGRYPEALEDFAVAEKLLTPLASPASGVLSLAERMASIYFYRALTYEGLHETQKEIADLEGVLTLCRTLIRDRNSVGCRRTVWRAQAQLGVALAVSGDTDRALRETGAALNALEHPPAGVTVPVAYRARVLGANGAVHMLMARHASGEQQQKEKRIAQEYYAKAAREWQKAPSQNFEPFRSEIRATQTALAEASR